jgi:hypothetical protein
MSTTEVRTELFTTLQEVTEQIPGMRIGQLLAAIGELCEDLHSHGLWEASDSELLEAIWQFQQNFHAASQENNAT